MDRHAKGMHREINIRGTTVLANMDPEFQALTNRFQFTEDHKWNITIRFKGYMTDHNGNITPLLRISRFKEIL
jgi:hypothetical protein